MVYPFENAAYNTEIGKISKPVRTKYGYHLIKVNDKRKANGEVRVAHIMFKLAKDASEEAISIGKTKIDEIATKLKNGEDFSDLAKQFSEDRATAVKGGSIPWFGVGKMVKEFEDVAFSLQTIDEISAAFKTAYGWHIVKLLENRPILSFEKMKDFTKKYNFQPLQNTAVYLSIDFWSKQSKILKDNDYYILRSGGGTFVILDKKQFPNAYLDLSISDYTEMETKEDPEFPELYKAFRKEPGDRSKQENSALEHPRALGCYDKLVEGLFGNVKWYVGPRGGKHSRFKVYGKNQSNGDPAFLYDYAGPEELDYTIWTKDCILLFEAKSLSRNEGLDVGWHKMAYPASRFSKINNYTIKPIYFLKWGNIIHLFVFPKFQFYNDGIIINDKKNQIPEKIFRIDYSSTLQDFL